MWIFEPIVRGLIKQAYLTHEAGINGSQTIGYFLGAIVVTILGQEISPQTLSIIF